MKRICRFILLLTLGLQLNGAGVETKADLKNTILQGAMKEVDEIVFAMRKPAADGHWYANIGYYSDSDIQGFGVAATKHHGKRVAYIQGGKLGKYNLRTGQVQYLIDDPQGGVRDPIPHYDGKTILFSYRKGDEEHYHLYTIQSDGTALTQLTDGDYDDIEPCWLPDGDIVFVSTRAKRWVNCWVTQVATLHRCDAKGGQIHAISANNEQDNTPWVLPDGRIIYQRWEYVDRSQVDYHHLWTANPDGTGQMVYYGNQQPGTVMIDAKPIPNTDKVVAIFSPGHGQRDHSGPVAIVDPQGGPDNNSFSKIISQGGNFCDPWAFSQDAFLVANETQIQVMNGAGATANIYKLSPAEIQEGYLVHEPRPMISRVRENSVAARVNAKQSTGQVIVANIYEGRNMSGIKQGEIKKLLVLETLPKPINFTGGMDPLTYGGSFTLERILGTVPVEADGSASVELPAMRGLFFVALDENDMAVKRMQSFLCVQPGEVVSCTGCHELRTQSYTPVKSLLATQRQPSSIEPIAGCPDVFDFPRDIQPILNQLCADCHGYEKTARGGPYAGKLILTGDHGPMFSHSYFSMTIRKLFSDGRNMPQSNYKPRSIGSSASRIMHLVDVNRLGFAATEEQKKKLRLWIDSGAVYPGTYAALGCGMIGGYAENTQVHTDFDWPTTKAGAAVMQRRCDTCHQGNMRLPHALSDEMDISFWRFDMNDPRLRFSRHAMFNLDRPEKSLIALAPLSVEAGGFGLCGKTVFDNTKDPDYMALVEMVDAGKRDLQQIKRFDMAGFRPRDAYLGELRRYGVLTGAELSSGKLNPYDLDQRYWRSLWLPEQQANIKPLTW